VGLEKVLGQKVIFRCVLGNNKKPALVIDNNYKIEENKENLSETESVSGDIYDLAKEIFG
jgi:hypothetical protein